MFVVMLTFVSLSKYIYVVVLVSMMIIYHVSV